MHLMSSTPPGPYQIIDWTFPGRITHPGQTGTLSTPVVADLCLGLTPARRYNPEIPSWVDSALEKAVNPNLARRYDTLSEFLHDLNNPNECFKDPAELPFLERPPAPLAGSEPNPVSNYSIPYLAAKHSVILASCRCISGVFQIRGIPLNHQGELCLAVAAYSCRTTLCFRIESVYITLYIQHHKN